VADRVLTLRERELNCATLARKMLLYRELVPVTEAIERLTGLHAQLERPPYIGLWTTLRSFQRGNLIRLMTVHYPRAGLEVPLYAHPCSFLRAGHLSQVPSKRQERL
jgi:hypothetical protein